MTSPICRVASRLSYRSLGVARVQCLNRSLSRAAVCAQSSDPGNSGGDNKKGFLKSVIYGSQTAKEKAQEDDRSASHSKVVGRGKYIHELQTHQVKPDCAEDYVKLCAGHYPTFAKESGAHLVGSWRVIIGNLDTFYHIWEYAGWPGFHDASEKINHLPANKEFGRKFRSMITSRQTQMMQEFAFWPTSAPHETNGAVYELRSYQLIPGTLLEWEQHWKRGLEARRKFAEPVGAYFSQIGGLHQVHHMWCYKDLEARKHARESAWSVEGWPEAVSRTVKLCYSMHASILRPLDFSPLH